MAFKSVLDIEVNQSQFDGFLDLFDKYQDSLNKTPAAWRKVNKETKDSFATMATALAAQSGLIKGVAKAGDDSAKATHAAAFSWKSIADSTKTAAGQIKNATEQLLKWTGITAALGGLLGAGGLYGIDRLALSVGTRRTQAQGLGVSYGALSSFEASFGRLGIDPNAFLGEVGAALHTAGGAGILGRAGLTSGQMLGDTSQVSVNLLRQLKTWSDTWDPSIWQQNIAARGLGQFGVDWQTLNVLHQQTPQDFEDFIKQFQGNQTGLGLDPDTQKRWQDLNVQLGLAGRQIETVLVKGLTGLAGPLNDLSKSVITSLSTFFDLAGKRHWIDDLGTALEHLAQYLGSDDFQKDIKTVADDFSYAAKKIADGLRYLGLIPDNTSSPSTGASIVAPADLGAAPGEPGFRLGVAMYPHGFDEFIARQNGTTPGAIFSGGHIQLSAASTTPGLAGSTVTGADLLPVVRHLEASGDTAVSPEGAIGRYQVTTPTALTYGGDPRHLTDPDYEGKLANKILDDLLQKYHGDIAEVLAAYNAGPEGSRAFREHGDDPSYLSKETRDYLARAQGMALNGGRVIVEIFNNTGGNAIVQTAQVAH